MGGEPSEEVMLYEDETLIKKNYHYDKISFANKIVKRYLWGKSKPAVY